MPKEYDNTNRGALFRNTRKSEPKHADFNGTINVEGKEYWLNMWDNDGNGPSYRLTVKAKESNQQSVTKQNRFSDDLD